jgi:hypothetical protein
MRQSAQRKTARNPTRQTMGDRRETSETLDKMLLLGEIERVNNKIDKLLENYTPTPQKDNELRELSSTLQELKSKV